MSLRRIHQALVLFAFLGLGLSLITLFGWGVIGKHLLDEDAADVYNATRAVHREPVLMAVLTSSSVLRGDVPPPSADAGFELLVARCELPPAASYALSPSRAPPPL